MTTLIEIFARIEKIFFKMLNAISSEPLTILPVLVFILVVGIVAVLKIPNISDEIRKIVIGFLGFSLIIVLIALLLRGCLQDEYSYKKSKTQSQLQYNIEKETDNAANKVSQRPGAHPAVERIVNRSFIIGNYRLQGGNLQKNWYQSLKIAPIDAEVTSFA